MLRISEFSGISQQAILMSKLTPGIGHRYDSELESDSVSDEELVSFWHRLE
jgi:hypothetical protein